jgi:hypothetical protein
VPRHFSSCSGPNGWDRGFLGRQPRPETLHAFDDPDESAGGEQRREAVAPGAARGQRKMRGLSQDQQAQNDPIDEPPSRLRLELLDALGIVALDPALNRHPLTSGGNWPLPL